MLVDTDLIRYAIFFLKKRRIINYLHQIQRYKKPLIIGTICILYLVGIVGISIPKYRDLILPLTPLNLWLTTLLFSAGYEGKRKALIYSFVITFVLGVLVEIIGVQTGVLFGEYEYGKTLGSQIAGVPWVIGANWFLLVACGRGIACGLSQGVWLRILLGVALTIGIDILIEPVAIILDFWQWKGGEIPIQNFIMWGLTAVVMHYMLSLLRYTPPLWLSLWFYGVQTVFFLYLYLIL